MTTEPASGFSPDCDTHAAGIEMYEWLRELFPICRSITGEGFRRSISILQQHAPIEQRHVPTGTQVFDWTVPREWNIRDAYVKNAHGERVIDFRASNLHVLNYSTPVHARMSLEELRPHLFSLPDQPDCIPYRTSYYSDNWGFCLAQTALERLEEGEYEVCIDSTLDDGCLTYGEVYLPGATREEVLFSCHSCHPSLCNDNLSGMVLAACLARHLAGQPRRYSYRFLFIPGAIGSITWLASHEEQVPFIRHGLVIAGVGDAGAMHYKKSRRGDAEIDRAAVYVLRRSGDPYVVNDFSPYGYDERQFCSPGFNLPVGCLTRTPHGQYPQYHTSDDNLDFVQPQYLADSLGKYLRVLEVLEYNGRYRNLSPKCEPQLGKRGLYGPVSGFRDTPNSRMALLWVLNLSDGGHSLLDIAERADLDFTIVRDAAHALVKVGLLELIAAGSLES